jgi:hypothetical protein
MRAIAQIGHRGRALLILFVVALVASTAAWAYWSAPSSGSAAGRVGELGAPTISSATPGGEAVALAWSAVTPPAGGTVSYYVSRDGAPAGSGCPSATSPGPQTSCTDTGVAVGSHTYTVTAVWRSWTAKSAGYAAQVTSGAATHLVLTPATTTPTAGAGDNLTITAKDASNNTVTSYSGAKTLTFSGASAIGSHHPTVTDSAGVARTLATPESIEFSSGVATVNGVSNGAMTLYKAETASIRVSDGTIDNGGGTSVTVGPAGASSFALSTPSGASAGTPINETLTALDAYGNAATGYIGKQSISFSGPSNSPGGKAPSYPASVEFKAGVGTGSITLYDAQTTTLTATQGALNGTSPSFTVTPASASSFTVPTPATQTAGNAFSVTLTAEDAYGNTATGYSGNHSITFSGAAKAPDGTSPKYPSSQIGFSAGVGTASITLYDAQTTTLTATQSTITGTSASFTVAPGSATSFGLGTPATQTAGTAFNLTLTAKDGWGNTATGYEGAKTIAFSGAETSPNGKAPSYPASVSFSAGVGNASLTLYAADSGTTIAATQGSINDSTGEFVVNAATTAGLSLNAASLTPSAGASDSLTIAAVDAFGNKTTSYSGSKPLTFGGAQSIGANHPTVTNSSGTAVAFGSPTTISFTSGEATVQSGSRNGAMKLYAAETAKITVSDGTFTNGSGLSVTVGAGPLTISVANPGTQIAGTAFNLAITAKDSFGNGASGALALSFSGGENSASEKAPSYPSSVAFTAGAGAGAVALSKASPTTDIAVSQGSANGSTGNFAVNAGAAAKLAWSGAVGSGQEEGLCLFTCTWSGIGKNHTWSAKVSVTDANGNVVSNIGSGHTVTWTGGPSVGSVAPSSLALPSSGTATTSSAVTYTSPGNNGWSSDTFTAHSSPYTDATALLKR